MEDLDKGMSNPDDRRLTFLPEGGETMKLIPPVMSTVWCGHCTFRAETYDAEVLERLHDSHECTPAPYDEPPKWHESFKEVGEAWLRYTFILVFTFLLISAFLGLPPWTS